MRKLTKKHLTQGLRWSLFIMTVITTSLKIAEVSAYNSLQIIVNNPEIAQYSSIVNGWYFFF